MERTKNMKAIYIKWIPATNTKPTRIKAYDKDRNSIIVSRDYELDGIQQGTIPALNLCSKMGWSQDLIGNGDVFVFANENRYRVKEIV